MLEKLRDGFIVVLHKRKERKEQNSGKPHTLGFSKNHGI